MDISITDYFGHRLGRLKENIQIIEASLTNKEDSYIEDKRGKVDLGEDRQKNLTEIQRINMDFFIDDIALFDEAKQLYRQSSFLMLYAFLEDGLNKVCQLIQAQFNYKLSINDLNGRGVFKYRNYLDKVSNLKIDAGLWKRLDNYRLIRNQLAHEFGEVDIEETQKSVNIIVENTSSLGLDDWGFTGFIRMEIEFLNKVISDIELLFSYIDTEISKASKIRIIK